MFILLFLFTTIKYDAQPINVTYLSSNNILVLLWALPLALSISDMEGMQRLFRCINWILLVWFVIVAAQGIVYVMNGNLILGFQDMFSGAIRIRNSRIRFELGGMANMMLLYNFDIVYTKKVKKRLLPLIVLLIGTFDVIFVQQTRMQLISLACGMAITLLIGPDNFKKKTISIGFLVMVLLILVSNNAISRVIESFSITGSESGSTVIRIQEISYYWKQFTSNIVFGIGGLSDATNSVYSSIVHSDMGIYYLDDIGYLGTLANGGLLLIGILLLMFKRMIKITSYVIKSSQTSRYSYALAIMVYLFVSGMTLPLVLTQKTNIFLPAIIVMFELIYDEICNKVRQ